MSDKPIYGPWSYALIIGTVTILAAWGVTGGSLIDDRPQCVGLTISSYQSAGHSESGES